MKNYKEFKVTQEILELFRDEKVSVNNVKRLIPNYRDYRISITSPSNTRYLDKVSQKLGNYLFESHYATAQRFLDDIQFILESEGLLRNDNAGEIFHFNGTDSYESGYGYYEVFETEEKTIIEGDGAVLERICSEIRIAKKKEKEELKNIEITSTMLSKIANDPVLMHQLLELKGN